MKLIRDNISIYLFFKIIYYHSISFCFSKRIKEQEKVKAKRVNIYIHKLLSLLSIIKIIFYKKHILKQK
jgi:hypothetical protein